MIAKLIARAQRRFAILEHLKVDSFSVTGEHRGLQCLVKGILTFLLLYGSLHSMIDAFEVPLSNTMVVSFWLLTSLILSFCQYKVWIKAVFYTLFLVGYVMLSMYFALYINSGFNAFLNLFYEKATDVFNISQVRTFYETIPDSELTLSMFFIFLGVTFGLLLNIFINSGISIYIILFLTFPLFQIGVYFRLPVPVLDYLALCFGYLGVLIFKRCMHFNTAQAPEALLQYYKPKKHRYTVIQPANGRATLHLFSAIGVVFLAGFLLFTLFTGKGINTLAPKSSLMLQSEAVVERFLTGGLSGLFGNGASGGVNGGQLNLQSGSITPDFETDLVVQYVPHSYQPVYLKAYTGSVYTGTAWNNLSRFSDLEQDALLPSLNETLSDQFSLGNTSVLRGRMSIKNLDANPAFRYHTYYGDKELDILSFNKDPENVKTYLDPTPEMQKDWDRGNITIYNSFFNEYAEKYGKEDELFYYTAPDLLALDEAAIKLYTTPLSGEAREKELELIAAYTALPDEVMRNPNAFSAYSTMQAEKLENLSTFLKQYCRVQGFSGSTIDIINQIQFHFQEDFTYSMNYGTVPRNQDYVQYFLSRNKKGVCSHFASAGVLLLRAMGIPARYVEGYVMLLSDISGGDILSDEDANYDEWISGENPLGRTAVVSVPLTDATAHAWVEVYFEGLGWLPVDLTPLADSNAEDFDNFWTNAARNLPSPGGLIGGINDILGGTLPIFVVILFRIIEIAGGLALVIFVLVKGRRYLLARRNELPFHEGAALAAVRQYETVSSLFSTQSAGLSPTEMGRLLPKNQATEDFVSLSNAAFYGPAEAFDSQKLKTYKGLVRTAAKEGLARQKGLKKIWARVKIFLKLR